MQKCLSYLLLITTVFFLFNCNKSEYGNYPGAKVSPYISIYDMKSVFKGEPVSLSADALAGSQKITGIVISDHSGKNIPEGLLIMQDARRLNMNSAIALNIGSAAANYLPGDSIVVDLSGGTLSRVDGRLQITGVSNEAISKISSGNNVFAPVIGDVSVIAQNPDRYENTVVIITSAEFNPPATEGETFAGEKMINNGSGDLTIYTAANASYATDPLPFLATYTGVLLRDEDGNFKLWPRTAADVIILSSAPPVIAPVIVTGFLNNATGSDATYEYIQLMATEDIDFSVTPMAIVTTNNAGSSRPTGIPIQGWATGGTRTYKFNLNSGTAAKGTFFYVGGNKVINGEGSTDISSSNWIVSRLYNEVAGDDFGDVTGNLLANSGNVAGIAVFEGNTVDSSSVPIDVVMFGGGGSNSFDPGPPPYGYKIFNTDYYETQNTSVPTLDPQPFYLMGTNTFKFSLVNDDKFRLLGGTYNTRSGKWTVKRTMTDLEVPATSTISLIETGGTTITDAR
ncbi:DUF5689 domain-containing protein [Niabella insulamsoli]|uniref:DUF5689 domain-containing protein n=1 Tax=Niabella insulamsoli TaxID=3144874 RepID=UPI0031FD6399